MSEVGSLQLGPWNLTFSQDSSAGKQIVCIRVEQGEPFGNVPPRLVLYASKAQAAALASLIQVAADVDSEKP